MSKAEYGWEAVAEATKEAKAIAWCGCHKIYLAMDKEQVRQFQSYGYGEDGSVLIKAKHATPDEMLTYLRTWWERSCGLRFISAVRTNKNPNAGFTDLIPQCWDESEEDTDEDD